MLTWPREAYRQGQGLRQHQGRLRTPWCWAHLEPSIQRQKLGECPGEGSTLTKAVAMLSLPGQAPDGGQELPASSLGVVEIRGLCGSWTVPPSPC